MAKVKVNSETITASVAAERSGLSSAMIRRKAWAGLIAGAYQDSYGFWRIPAAWVYVPLKRGPKANKSFGKRG